MDNHRLAKEEKGNRNPKGVKMHSSVVVSKKNKILPENQASRMLCTGHQGKEGRICPKSGLSQPQIEPVFCGVTVKALQEEAIAIVYWSSSNLRLVIMKHKYL